MTTTVFPAFRTTDADRTIALLEVLGFTERALYRDPDEPTTVAHAEFAHGDRGGVMFGSARGTGDDLDDRIGAMSIYVVLDSDAAVDDTHARALDVGARSVREPGSPDYGGREAGVRDHDGNIWSFGSYAGS